MLNAAKTARTSRLRIISHLKVRVFEENPLDTRCNKDTIRVDPCTRWETLVCRTLEFKVAKSAFSNQTSNARQSCRIYRL
jgi:hypothetical protein